MIDTLNFSFWSDDESNPYTVRYKDKNYTGYWSLCAAVDRALEEGYNITDPHFYKDIDTQTFLKIFRSETSTQVPLSQERVKNLQEVGQVLCSVSTKKK